MKKIIIILIYSYLLISCKQYPTAPIVDEKEYKDYTLTETLVSSNMDFGYDFGTFTGFNNKILAIAESDNDNSIWIYKRNSNNKWIVDGQLLTPYSTNGKFNHSSISIEGNFIAAGSWNIDKSEDDKVFVYYNDGSNQWKTNPATIKFNAGYINGNPGFPRPQLTLKNGYLIISSSITKNPNDVWTGAVFIYKHIGNNSWSLLQTIYPDNGNKLIGFGSSVYLWNNTLVISAIGEAKVYIYKLDSATQKFEYYETITNPEVTSKDDFGSTVLFNNGRLVVSSESFNDNSGKVYIYQNGFLEAELTSPVADEIFFGSHIDMYNDELVISSPHNTNKRQGVVYIYNRDSYGIWSLKQTIKPPDGQDYSWFGSSIHLLENVLVVSQPAADLDDYYDVGKVHIYGR